MGAAVVRAFRVLAVVIGQLAGGIAGRWLDDSAPGAERFEPLRGRGRLAGAAVLIGCAALVILAIVRP